MRRDTLLFDLDGTMTDSDALHIEAYRRILAPAPLSVADYRAKVMGATNPAIMEWMFPGRPVAEHEALSDRKERLFRSLVEHLEPTPGLPALLAWAGRHGIRVGVVTNAPRANAELMLAALGLGDRFPVLVIGDELARGKPDPLPYLTGLERLGSTPERALAFEDSRSGVRAAAAAGIETIGMRTSLDDATLRQEGAAWTMDDFTDRDFLARLEADFGHPVSAAG
ncbi:beta-phosphoglucomutase [Stella humosa]|uniref:Beta-phosphoglucomutase n=1 Tax=Stella humosa TaxID=94 RepID=A0A3N1MEJ3_9PROT|nr:HAD family phosphatase [Stella humosa]ROQ01555.1 beta-phosphoglucomutase [Stella humosa]BBK31935.1 haloacid dehalogenase [Stella humosa]